MMTAIKPTQRVWRLTAVAVAASLALVACENKNVKREQEIAKKMAANQPTVSVLTVYPSNVLLENDLPGRLESVRTADIVPQVSGIVKRRLFDEGTMVQAGQPLYQIDDASYNANLQSAQASLMNAQAGVAQAEATLANAEAALAKAQADVARYRPLVKADAISKQEWDAALAAERSAQAQVKSAQAAVRSSHAQIKSAEAAINAAQVNVRHANIVAPISGYIGQSLVTEGALVTANSTKMASIRQNDPLYVNITQSAGEILELRRQLASGQKVLNSAIEVGIVLEDGSEYPHKGRLLFADSTVDKNTGQVTVRAAIPNPEQMLMSGLYVRVKLPLAGILDAYVVPQSAVTRGKTDTVMIVTSEGKMEPRTVTIGGQKGSNWVITEGLSAGDKVVIDGTMIAGMLKAEKVQTKEWEPPEGSGIPTGMPMSASDAQGAEGESEAQTVETLSEEPEATDKTKRSEEAQPASASE